MKLRSTIIGTIILTITAMFVAPARPTGVVGIQTKPKYEPTGSEGSLIGKITFDGKIPQPKLIDTSSDPACGTANSELYTEDVIIKAGKLANVLIYVQSGETLDWYTFDSPSTAVSLAHRGCQYVPHVMAMQLQQTLKIANEDATTHNTHLGPKNSANSSESQAQNSAPLEKKFRSPEVAIPVRDNQHPWEKAYVAVLSHPFFAVTGQNGSYKITGLPPGQYTVVAWHEKFGEQRTEVSVGVNEKKNLDFTFKPGDN